VSAKQVDTLAQSLLRKSGVDDEVIKSGENVLLTFRNIRNVAGEGNDVFNQATTATLNLSVALGKDMSSSAILVGKALNDPIKGMTALSRAGIQFTADQKETIKTMVATGDVMGAQKIILGELTAEFGGSAAAAGKTFSGQMDIARESLKNVGADILGMAMPALKGFASGLTDVVGKVGEFADKLGDAHGLQAKLGVVTSTLTGWATGAFDAISGAFARINWGAVWDVVSAALAKVPDVVGAIGSALFSVAGKVFGGLKAAFDAINWGAVWDVVSTALKKVPTIAGHRVHGATGVSSSGVFDSLMNAFRRVGVGEDR
jgi:hypothetical protein